MAHCAAFHAHIALALQLIALVAGCILLAKACASDFPCKKSGKIFGGFVIIVALLSTICILYISISGCLNKNPMFKSMKWHHPPIEQSAEAEK